MEAIEPNAWRVGWLMFWMAVRWWISQDFWHRESSTTTTLRRWSNSGARQSSKSLRPPKQNARRGRQSAARVGQRGRDTQQRTDTDATDATNAMTQSKSDRGGREGEGDRGNGAGRREPIGPGRGRFLLLTFEERSAIGLTRKRKVNFEECRPNPSLPLRRPRRRSPRRFSPAPMALPPRTSPRSILFEDHRR